MIIDRKLPCGTSLHVKQYGNDKSGIVQVTLTKDGHVSYLYIDPNGFPIFREIMDKLEGRPPLWKFWKWPMLSQQK